MAKRATQAIRAMRQLEGRDITNVECLYCMDSKRCRICNGIGTTPTPFGATIRAILCYACGGRKTCQYCSPAAQDKQGAA